MVTKTDTCSYSTFKIYPGIGRRFVSKNATLSYFISTKARSMFHQGIKPVYLAWTMTWRGKHKKIRSDDNQRRHTRKAAKVRKAVVGMSLDEIKRRRGESRTDRDSALASAAAEVKARKLKIAAAKKADKAKMAKTAPAAAKAAPKQKVQKGGKR
jgi:large subunit ribosomal protein L24e